MKVTRYFIAIAIISLILIPSIALAGEYTPDESATIYAQVLDSGGNPVNDATATLTLWDTDGNKELDAVNMTYIAGSQGLYEYDFTIPSELGVYVAEVVTVNPTGYGSGELHVVEAAGGNDTCSVNATTIWGEDSTGYTDSSTFGGLINYILGGGIMEFGLPQIIFALGLLGFALWKKGWVRVLLAICIIIWGVFAMSYDIKIAAPLLAIGTILFFMDILKMIQQYRASKEEA